MFEDSGAIVVQDVKTTNVRLPLCMFPLGKHMHPLSIGE